MPPMDPPSGTKGKNHRFFRSLTFFVLLLLALWLVGYRVAGHFTTISFPAMVEGTEIEVSPRVSGTIRRLEVQNNSTVRAGQLLAVLENRSARAEIEAASQDLAKLKDALADARNEASLLLRQFEVHEKVAEASAEKQSLGFEIQSLGREISAASATLSLKRERLRRMETLYQQKALVLSELEAFRMEVSSTEIQSEGHKSQLLQKRAQLEALSTRQAFLADQVRTLLEKNSQEITDMEIKIRQKEGELRTLLAQQEELTIRAEKGGVISRIHLSVGENVSTGEPIMRIATGERIWVETYLTSDKVDQLREGDHVEVRIDPAGRVSIPATVKGLLPDMQTQPGYVPGPFEGSTVKVAVALVEFDDPETAKARVRPGQRVTTYLMPGWKR